MLKYTTHDIVFQEFPDEVTIAVNLSRCPNLCPGCHSAYLQGDIGEPLTLERLTALADSYAGSITCVALMGGDNDPDEVLRLLQALRQRSGGKLRTGWYSGRTWQPAPDRLAASLSYLKLGPYIERRGPLSDPETNQRFYSVEPDGSLTDLTHRFRRKH